MDELEPLTILQMIMGILMISEIVWMSYWGFKNEPLLGNPVETQAVMTSHDREGHLVITVLKCEEVRGRE
jgi:hypothetical protein